MHWKLYYIILHNLLNMLKREIKDKSNSDKINLYIFKILNAQFSRENYHNICLISAPSALFNIFQRIWVFLSCAKLYILRNLK
jgi:hypothetical protein